MILMTPVGLLNLLMGYNRISILELNLLGILVILFRELILKLIINFQLSKPILSISLSILTKNKNLILGKVFLLYLVIKKIINNIINLIINNHCLIKITKKINMLKVSVMTQIKLTTTKINILIKENFHFLAKNNWIQNFLVKTSPKNKPKKTSPMRMRLTNKTNKTNSKTP